MKAKREKDDVRLTYMDYVHGVEDGSIVACVYVRQAVARFKRFMEDGRMEFREERVRRVVRYFFMLRHFAGKSAGNRFVLEPWQQFIIAAIYGFYWRESGRRVTTSVYLEMARKNGKTAFAAGLSLYHMTSDGEEGAEVYLAANSRDQAKIAYNFAQKYAEGMDKKHQLLQVFRDNIVYKRRNSMMRVLAADASKLDGPNPSMYLLDEFHAAKDTRLKDVLQSGQGMREEPMEIIITTAGFDKLGPCYEKRQTCTEILGGVKTEDSTFAIIYTLDDGDDWKDEAVWVKANPNIGVTVREDYLRRMVEKAENTPSEEAGIRTKNMNTWVDAETVWIPDHYIVEQTHGRTLDEFAGRDAYAGIDLSATYDLASIALMVPGDEGCWFWTRYYLPEASLTENRFHELYGKWRRAGALTVTPGNVIDYDYILNDLMEMGRVVNLQKVAYDTWNATQFVINATDAGLPMEPFSQLLGNFNRPTKEMERLLMSGRAFISNNVINRHCFRNVVLARDRQGNTKPTKQFEEKKIDGVIAMLEALGVWLLSPRYGEFV